MGWTADSVIAHREWQPGKPDPSGPGFPSMAEFRRRVQAYIDNPPNAKKFHTVQAGDTFWGIGRKYGVSVEDLVRLNPQVSPSLIHPGDQIRVK
jgi:nucleoid-associated protein YgaU